MRAVNRSSTFGRALAVAFWITLTAAGCGGSIANYDYAKEPDPRKHELILGVGDQIAINVWEIRSQVQNFVRLNAGTEITVAVRSYKSYHYTVQGEVTKTGVFTSDQFVTVSDALAQAGGLTRFAKRSGILLTRRNAKTGELYQIPLDYEALASGKRPDMNIYVMPGDSIWVP